MCNHDPKEEREREREREREICLTNLDLGKGKTSTWRCKAVCRILAVHHLETKVGTVSCKSEITLKETERPSGTCALKTR